MTGQRVAWTAGPDGIGHARIGNAFRTPCGLRPEIPRHAWPIDARCPACTRAVEALSKRPATSAAR